MIHVFGAVLLFAGWSLFGLAASQTLSERVRLLQEWIAVLGWIGRELSFTTPLMDHLMTGAADQTSGRLRDFFLSCVCSMEDLREQSWPRIWCSALEQSSMDLCPEAKYSLEKLGNILGRYDSDSQCSALEHTRAELRGIMQEAQVRNSSAGRVYRTLGVCLGIFSAIVML